jgi:cyanophycin synthetase
VAAAARGSAAGHEGNGRAAGAVSDVTERVHPEVAARAADVARALGLDVAGVDVVAADIGRPLEEQGGVVVGVEPRPGLYLHLEPSSGARRPVGAALVEHLFPAGQTGRIPVVGVTGVNGKTTTTRLIAHLVAGTGRTVGMTCTEGIHVGGRRIQSGDCSGPKSARVVLQHPRVEAAVLEVARGGILREGLGFDRCDVAVVTNIGEGDHLGLAGVDTVEDLARVKSTLVGAVARGGTAVLNAEDPLVAGMATSCRGSVIYFAREGSHPVLVQHRAEKGRAVFVRNRQVVLAEGEKETPLAALDRVPLTHGGRVGFQVLNALAGAAAGWALGLGEEALRAGLESFAACMTQVPGRFNLLDIGGTTVIVDYGHNVSSLKTLIEAIGPFPQRWRSAVYSAAGDRRDCDLIRQGELLGAAFDRVILYEDAYRRGRAPGEIMALFRRGLDRGRRVREVQEVHGGLKAVELALRSARAGELLVIQPDDIDPTVQFLQGWLASGPAGREVGLADVLAAAPPGPPAPGDDPARVVEVRPGRLGKGLFATRPIPRGQVILERWGPRTSSRSRHSVQVDEDTHIIPLPPLHLIAHSCGPNCGLLVRREAEVLELHALRRIEPGEELTVDYATFEYDIEFLDGPCSCNAPSCRGRVTGYKDLPRELRRAYGPYIAEYLREMEAALVEVR